MANTFLTPSLIGNQALANLYENTVMAQLVHRDHSADFRGKQGDTVTIRKPATFTAEEFVRANGITVQDGTEAGVAVVLDTFLDVSFAATTEEMTYEIERFNEQLLFPATEAISQAIDRKILTLRADVTAEVGTATGDEWNEPGGLIAAGRVLDIAKVPTSQRSVAMGAITKANLIADPLFHQADQRGNTEGLIEAAVGRKFGFDTYMTQNVAVPNPQGTGISTTEENVAFHKTAFALVTRTPALPPVAGGASQGVVVDYKGFGLRIVSDYNISTKQFVISVDTLIGVKTMDATRAVLIKGADGA